MHTIFKESLKNAIGVAKFVIAINIDVRGFSSFSKQVESPESALFIKKIFLKIINKYFNTASFFKSTGDGWQARMDTALKEWVKAHPAVWKEAWQDYYRMVLLLKSIVLDSVRTSSETPSGVELFRSAVA